MKAVQLGSAASGANGRRARPAPSSSVRPPPAAAARRDRRQAILLAAERLFAMHGYRAVTIRQIAEEAQVPLALVGYYFGPKQALFHAIFEHWRPTIDERTQRLQDARAANARRGDASGKPALRRIVAAFVEPVLHMRASAEGEYYALLVARELAFRAPEIDRVLGDFFDPMAHAFIDALHGACPGCTRGQAAWAYQFALGSLIHHISDHRVTRLSRGENTPNDPAAGVQLVAFLVAGIHAALQPARTTPAQKQPRRPTR